MRFMDVNMRKMRERGRLSRLRLAGVQAWILCALLGRCLGQGFVPPSAFQPMPPNLPQQGLATPRLDADGVPMATGVDLYGTGGVPSAVPSVPASSPIEPRRFSDLRFDVHRSGQGNASEFGPSSDFKSGRLLAVVGVEPIIEGDIRPMVDPIMHKAGVPKEEWDAQRERLLRPALAQRIIHKCLAQRFIHEMVGAKPPKEHAEAIKRIYPKLAEGFHEKMIPKLKDDYEVSSDLELDQKLRDSGTSLFSQQRLFRDQVLSQQAIERNVPKKKEILLPDLRDYYDSHPEAWQQPARAKWRQLTVRFKNHPNKQVAYEKIERLLNEVLYGGTPFEAVAKRMSEGFTASQGGTHDWTTKGSLRSVKLDTALFQYPLKRLSPIIEDDEGFHIIEVLEREDARIQPMEEVQLSIRKRLEDDHWSNAVKEYTDKVRSKTNIWSLWPQDLPGSRPLSELSPE